MWDRLRLLGLAPETEAEAKLGTANYTSSANMRCTLVAPRVRDDAMYVTQIVPDFTMKMEVANATVGSTKVVEK